MAKTSGRLKTAAATVPQSREEAAEFLASVGQEDRQVRAIEDRLAQQIEDLKQQARQEASPHIETIKKAVQGLSAFAHARRDELTAGDLKTIKELTGEYGWRKGTDSIEIVGDVAKVADQIAELGHEGCCLVREPKIIKKMVKQHGLFAKIKALVLKPGKERFFVKPAGVEALSEMVEEALKDVA